MTREEALNILHNSSVYHPMYLDALNMAIKELEQQQKTGYWIKEKSIYGWDGHSYQCSECGRSIHLDLEVEDLDDYPYCHCGAKMIELREKEE